MIGIEGPARASELIGSRPGLFEIGHPPRGTVGREERRCRTPIK